VRVICGPRLYRRLAIVAPPVAEFGGDKGPPVVLETVLDGYVWEDDTV
jgi:hypothetical protein